ncbi:hypothetical protein MOF11_13380 [Bacillus haynesii]|uniref:hypothetical protein n=1 Tax=Bacillus haynesii TaxID=1925021 RepID=UPI00228291F4|nr:hypothetical protein [Bacillus haynesii]MCY9226016.1 hypothetical protein [Bacillus haynesii]
MNYKDSKAYKHLGDMKHDFTYKVTKIFGEIEKNSDMTDKEKLSALTRDLLTEVHSLFFELDDLYKESFKEFQQNLIRESEYEIKFDAAHLNLLMDYLCSKSATEDNPKAIRDTTVSLLLKAAIDYRKVNESYQNYLKG